MGFLNKFWRNRQQVNKVQVNKVYIDHSAAGHIGQLRVDGGTLAVGFVSKQKTDQSDKTGKILHLFKRNGEDWTLKQQFSLDDFINIPSEARAGIHLWSFWPKLELEKDTLVFSRGYEASPETQPQRHLHGEPPSNDDLDEIYTLKHQDNQWASGGTIGNTAPVPGFNSGSSRIYKVYTFALRDDALATLVDGKNITSGLHVFKRTGAKWSLLQQLPLACPQNWQEVRDKPGPSSIFLDDDILAVYTGAYNGKRELMIFGRKDQRWSLERTISETQPLGALTLGSHIDPDRADYHDYNHFVQFLRLDDNRLAIRVQEQYAFESINDVYILRRDKSGWKLEANIAEKCDPDNFNSYWQLKEKLRQSGRLLGNGQTPPGIAFLVRHLVSSDSCAVSKQGNRIAMVTYDEDRDTDKLLIFKKDNEDWLMEQEILSTEITNDPPFVSNSLPRGAPALQEVALDDRTLAVHVTFPRKNILSRSETHHFNESVIYVLTRRGKKWLLQDKLGFLARQHDNAVKPIHCSIHSSPEDTSLNFG